MHIKLPKLERTSKKQVNRGSKDKLRHATISGDAFIAMLSTFLHKMTIVRTVTRRDEDNLNPLLAVSFRLLNKVIINPLQKVQLRLLQVNKNKIKTNGNAKSAATLILSLIGTK